MSDGFDAIRTQIRRARFHRALESLESLESSARESEQGLYLKAVCERYLNRTDEAFETVEGLIAASPQYGRAWQERGHTCLARNEPNSAQHAYTRAVELNPALLASWRALAGFAERAGNQLGLSEARNQIEALSRLPREIASATSMMHEGRLLKAERLCRAYLRSHPKDPEGMRLLAALGVQTGVLDDAQFLLESALEFEPGNRQARLDYVNVLYRRQKYRESVEQARLLFRLEPGNLAVQVAYANQCVAVGDFDTGLRLYEKIARLTPRSPTVHLSHGHALKTVGRVDEAIDAYRRAYAARPEFGDAYWSLANLKTYRFTPDEFEAMTEQESSGRLGNEDRAHICFALGKHHEDTGSVDTSFSYYARGNEIRRVRQAYDAEANEHRVARQMEACDAALFDRHGGAGCPDPDPIFVVGMPRAGSTLLEQILSSHSMVDGTMELHNIPAIARQLDGRRRRGEEPRYPAILKDLTAEKIRALGERYIEETQVHRAGAPFFIDKLPNNFFHVGLIKLILPNARVIDARRNAMSCCFSNFKQLFASGQEFSYSLEDLGRFYCDYVRLMDHWDAVLPGFVLRVQYEDVVADLESQVRKLLDFCGLPWEDACLRYHETDRSIRTPSSEQVRQPIYRGGLEPWREFSHHLEPLRVALEPVMSRDVDEGRCL